MSMECIKFCFQNAFAAKEINSIIKRWVFAFAVSILLARIWHRLASADAWTVLWNRWSAGWWIPDGDHRARDEHRTATFAVIADHRPPNIWFHQHYCTCWASVTTTLSQQLAPSPLLLQINRDRNSWRVIRRWHIIECLYDMEDWWKISFSSQCSFFFKNPSCE